MLSQRILTLSLISTRRDRRDGSVFFPYDYRCQICYPLFSLNPFPLGGAGRFSGAAATVDLLLQPIKLISWCQFFNMLPGIKRINEMVWTKNCMLPFPLGGAGRFSGAAATGDLLLPPIKFINCCQFFNMIPGIKRISEMVWTKNCMLQGRISPQFLSDFTNRKYMKNNSSTLSFCTANCCSWFYHLPVWYKCLCNCQREFVCKAIQSMMHCSERRGQEVGCHSIESELIAIEEHGCYQGLGRLVAIHKVLPSWDHREKGGQHPILEVYYFHISLYVCEPLVPLW